MTREEKNNQVKIYIEIFNAAGEIISKAEIATFMTIFWAKPTIKYLYESMWLMDEYTRYKIATAGKVAYITKGGENKFAKLWAY